VGDLRWSDVEEASHWRVDGAWGEGAEITKVRPTAAPPQGLVVSPNATRSTSGGDDSASSSDRS
jgi:hypothetical protein